MRIPPCCFDGDDLPLQVLQGADLRLVLAHGDDLPRIVVPLREGDLLRPLGGDGHGGDDGVVLPLPEAGDEAVEGLVHELRREPHLAGRRPDEVHVEAHDVALCVHELEGGVGGVRAHDDPPFVLLLSPAAGEGKEEGEEGGEGGGGAHGASRGVGPGSGRIVRPSGSGGDGSPADDGGREAGRPVRPWTDPSGSLTPLEGAGGSRSRPALRKGAT
jgi:hypothetical protein